MTQSQWLIWPWAGVNFRQGWCFWAGKWIHAASFFTLEPWQPQVSSTSQGNSSSGTLRMAAHRDHGLRVHVTREACFSWNPFYISVNVGCFILLCCQACLAEVCLDLTLPYSLLRLRSWVEDQILNLGQSSWWYHSGPTLRWLYSLYSAFLYINFGAWSGCHLSGKFYPRSSLLLIQISVSSSLTNAMSRPLHSCVFYFQSSHHSSEMILYTFLFPCWIPLSSYQNVSPTRDLSY